MPLLLGEPALVPSTLKGEESLSTLYSYTIMTKTAANPLIPWQSASNIEIKDLIGKEMTIEIELDGSGLDAVTGVGKGIREISGLVQQARFLGRDANQAKHEFVIRPWLYLTDLTADYKIFQNKNVVDIIDEVLSDYNFPLDKRLSGSYPQLDFQVQYGETDFNFIQRLMEEWGIYWFFEHHDHKHKMVIVDHVGAHKKFKSSAYHTLKYEPDLPKAGGEYVTRFDHQESITTGSWVTNDYDFTKSRADIMALDSKPRKTSFNDMEVYHWPGDYDQPGIGEQLAKVRIEELGATGSRATGFGELRGVVCGSNFNLKGFPVKKVNREYLIISSKLDVEEVGQVSGQENFKYQCEFTVQPTTKIYRHPRTAIKPKTRGPQTAIVVGPRGQEIWTDKYGRVKVHFLWDRYGKNIESDSCWLRVSQAWAGNNFGGINIPRIGHEVIVDFLNGDPDRPLILGSLYNNVTMPPWDLPANATQSGIVSRTVGGGRTNFNGIRFEDKPGLERYWEQAERDMSRLTKANEKQVIGANSNLKVGLSRTKFVGGFQTANILGFNSLLVGGAMTTVVGAVQSNTVGGANFVNVGGLMATTVGAANSLAVGGANAINVGGVMSTCVGGANSLAVGGVNAINVGGAMSTAVGGAISTAVGGASSLAVGGAAAAVAGGAFAISSGGMLTISASNIKIVAGGKIVIQAGEVDINPGDCCDCKGGGGGGGGGGGFGGGAMLAGLPGLAAFGFIPLPLPLPLLPLPILPPIVVPPVTKPPVTRPPVTRPPVTQPPVTRPPVTQPPVTRPPVTQPPVTQPPVTQPPVTRPPVTQPPVTQPPVTQPPVTQPPVTRPPVTQPPVTQPPVTRPPVTQPPVTQPPVTEPPVTEPPVTEPPVTEPPVTEPPVTEPPVTEPPVTEPPVTEPPVTEPPVTEPPVTEPPVTEPPVTEPPVTEPPVTEPPVTEPPVTKPPVTEPPVTEPPVTQPPVTEPPVTEPPVTEPPVTEPPVTEPPVTEPPVTEPPVTEPPVTEPPVTEPPVTEPPVTEPPVTEPPVTEPPVTEPPVTEPPVTEPPVTEPPVTEPPVTEPPVTEPPVTEPPVTEPPVTEPPVTEPPVTEPPVTEPPVTEPPVTPTWVPRRRG
ncbi:type VI secretion system tip protein TssI/VgrG [Erwinia rhapontici]|uniref:type VI secretion system Vgr family protein n=1 Tax=Erwinia rhapontici TaxID=55212 RepID=UPI003B9E55E9